jgi:hypothetical protein
MHPKAKYVFIPLGFILLIGGFYFWTEHKSEERETLRQEKEHLQIFGVPLKARKPLLEDESIGFQDGYIFEQYDLTSDELTQILASISVNKSLPDWQNALKLDEKYVTSPWERGPVLLKNLPLYLCNIDDQETEIAKKFHEAVSNQEVWFSYVLDVWDQEKNANDFLVLYVIDIKNSQFYFCSGNF